MNKGWNKKIKIKHLLTEDESHKAIQESMNKVADVLSSHYEFSMIVKRMKNIPKGDEYFKPVDYANSLIESMYNIADEQRIWIE